MRLCIQSPPPVPYFLLYLLNLPGTECSNAFYGGHFSFWQLRIHAYIHAYTRQNVLPIFFVCTYTFIIFKRTAFLTNFGFINAFTGPTPVPAYYWSSTNTYWKVRQWNLPCQERDRESCLFSSQMATTLKEVTPNLAQIFARSKYPCLASGCSSIVECLPGIWRPWV